MGEAGRRPVHDDVAKRVLNNEDTPTGGGYTPGEMRTMKDHATNYERGIEDYKAGIVFNDLENDRMYQLGRRKAQSDEQSRVYKKTETGAFDIPAADKPQVVASNPECRNDHTPRLKHTPGPWIIGPKSPDESFPIIADLTRSICEVRNPFFRNDKGQTQANAALIAAAPELLEALQSIAHQAERAALTFPNAAGRDDMLRIGGNARAAITKATGQEGHQ